MNITSQKENYGWMKIVAISATPVVVKSIMQDSLRPQFKSRVTVMQKAGTSIAEMKMKIAYYRQNYDIWLKPYHS